MATIVVVDDNRAVSAYLKMALTHQRHMVHRVEDLRTAIDRVYEVQPDMALVSRSFGNYRGWDMFYILKEVFPALPAMVYVMEKPDAPEAAGIASAVTQGIAEAEQQASKQADGHASELDPWKPQRQPKGFQGEPGRAIP